ncbi:MAG: putative T7SS-secreted protein [Pseudonocardiaceae bacterium]
MATELGETTDPKALVPGTPGSVTTTLMAMRGYGDALHEAGEGLKRINVAEGWSGAAGDAFREAFHGQPGKWLEAGDCFHDAASALETYSSTLTWAQGQAVDAIRQWNEGQTATSQAKSQHEQAVQQAGHDLPFNDPGEAMRQAARDTLNRARTQLSSAGDTAAKAVGSARDKAPEKPGFWDGVGDFFEDVGAGVANFAGHVVNGVASFSNAMLHHPEDLAATAAGLGLMLLGAGGEVGGVALDATGVGAVVGVPVNVVSAGAIATGGVMAAAGMGDLMMHSSSDDSVSPMRTDHAGSGGGEYKPTEGFRGSEFSKDEITEFVNGHTGGGNPVMGRPTPGEVDAALSKATPEKIPGQNAEKFEHNGVRVIVNYDMPWRSTSYYPGK